MLKGWTSAWLRAWQTANLATRTETAAAACAAARTRSAKRPRLRAHKLACRTVTRVHIAARAALALAALLATGASCSRFGPVYPPRPTPSTELPAADPQPTRVVVHLAINSAALRAAIDDAVPLSGDGSVRFLGSDRPYTWERGTLDVGFSQGRVVLSAKIGVTLSLPLKSFALPLDLRVQAEPIVNSEYAVKLQSLEVEVRSSETGLAIADRVAGIYDRIAAPVSARLKEFSYDMKPLLSEAYARLARPIDLPVGDAKGCARLHVVDVEAGPTILADGIEKDIALVVAASITLPCSEAAEQAPPTLPAMSNVSTVLPGPFTVTIPIAARYDELTRAMSMAFTDGKLFFSATYPALYLETPEIYESEGQLVLKLHIHGPVHELGIDSDLDGDLYLVGHPSVIDNELSIPDLEPTIETHNFLLSLKAMTDSDRIRDEARRALRLDLGERLHEVRDKLGDGLTFERYNGCFRGTVDALEVTGIHAHAGYVRVYVTVTARARMTMPCANAATAPP
jgi:hypothetical protein